MKRLSVVPWLKANLEWLIHLAAWALYFASIRTDWSASWVDVNRHAGRPSPFAALVFPLVFYANALVLIPRLLRQRRWLVYGLAVLLLLAALEALRCNLVVLGQRSTAPWAAAFHQQFGKDQIFYLAMGWAVVLSTGYRFTKDWLLNLRVIERLRAEKAAAELAMLKSQVDPHFLFNTLNSLYAQALAEGAPLTADAIAQLGTLMRYSLHDAQAEMIPLRKEMAFLEQYLALQKLRTTGDSRINYAPPPAGADLDRVRIAPLLLIPFVENACKYGIHPVKSSSIDLVISLEGSTLRMTVTNDIVAPSVDEGGLGLDNVRKRLQQHYPGRHQLEISETDATFRVVLQLQL